MAPRDALLEWLASAAARINRQRWVQDGSWAAVGLAVLCVAYLAIVRFMRPQAVVAALLPLFIMAAIAILAALVARRARRPGLFEAAAAADTRAKLRDGLISAYCFTQGDEDAFQALHVRRSAAAAAGIDPRQLFPLVLPRGAVAAVAGALLAAAAVTMLPRAADAPVEPLKTAVPGSSDAGRASGPRHADGTDENAPAAGRTAPAGLWKQIDALAASFAGSGAGQSLMEAIAARDARAAAEGIRALKQNATVEAGGQRKPSAVDEQMNDVLAQGILERLSELLKAEDSAAAAQAPATTSERPTARLDNELRAEQEDTQRAAPRQQSEGEDAVNTLLRALSRSSAGGQDRVRGEADSMDGAGRASVGGGAMGRRVGVSTAGAGEGDQPGANVTPRADSDSIFGKKTERLEVQLRKVKLPEATLDAAEEEERGGTEEASYEATRAQAAHTAAQSVISGSSSTAESVLDGQQSPVEYREAVKRYTLTRHRREAEQRATASSAQ
jgi:hypothetical protein